MQASYPGLCSGIGGRQSSPSGGGGRIARDPTTGPRSGGGGQPHTARKIEWTSQELGDGTGYDIKSFDPTGSERLIEVKATRGGPTTPFYLTRTERKVSAERPDAWRLYRLHDLSAAPALFQLKPPLEAAVTLTAETWWAGFRQATTDRTRHLRTLPRPYQRRTGNGMISPDAERSGRGPSADFKETTSAASRSNQPLGRLHRASKSAAETVNSVASKSSFLRTPLSTIRFKLSRSALGAVSGQC